MPRIGGIASFDDVVPRERVVATAPPLVGGGDLSVDRNLSVSIGTSAGTVASGNDARLNNARSWSLFTGNPTGGQVPTWNGSVFVPQSPSSSGSFTITTTKTANYTVGVGEFVPVDTSAGVVVLTLPTNPGAGIRVGWKLVTAGNTLTVACGGSDVFTKPGSTTTSVTAVLTGQGAIAQYDPTNHVWIIEADDLPLSELDARYAASGSIGGGGVPDATTSAKGIVQLAGDLGGNASAPLVINGEKTTRKSTAATPIANGYIGADASGLTPAALLPAATASSSGIMVLGGDLGGTAAAPTLIRRAPVGGIYAPAYTATLTPAPGSGVHMRVAACTGNVALAAPTAGGVDGQRYLIELQMTSTTARTVTLDPTYEIGANVTSRSIAPTGTATVWVYIGLVLRNTTWRVLAVDAGS